MQNPYLDVSIGVECSGTLPTCSHAVSVQVQDPNEKRRGLKWIDQGLMNGIEIYKLLTTFPSTVASDMRPHFERYRACRNDMTSVKQRYKKHVKFAADDAATSVVTIPKAPVAKRKKAKQPRTSTATSVKAGDDYDNAAADEDDEDDANAYVADMMTPSSGKEASRGTSPYDIGVVADDDQVPKAYVMYNAPRLNVKRKRRTPRTTAPPYTAEPLDPFAHLTAEHMDGVLLAHRVGPCTSSCVNASGWRWDPELFPRAAKAQAPVPYPLRIQNLVSKCVITGKEKLNPDDFRNVCYGNMRRFPAHTAKFTTCSQTLFEEGQMNIAGRTDQFDATRTIYLLLYLLARVTGKFYSVQNSGVVNIATSTDLKHRINLLAFRNHLLAHGHVAVYEPDHFPGSQWNIVPAGRKEEAYAKALARARAPSSSKYKTKKTRQVRKKKQVDADIKSLLSTQKGPVVQAFPTGKATLVGVQSVRSVRVAETTIIPYIANLVRTLPPLANTDHSKQP